MKRSWRLGVLVVSCALQGQVITTLAGTQWIFREGAAALAAPLGAIPAVATDAAGNIYACDASNDIVVRIAPSGALTVVAGNGLRGYSGDGGPATSASLSQPQAVAVDANGDLYIADSNNNRIRRVRAGVITTVAGNGVSGFSGDGGAATSAQLRLPSGVALDGSGNLYIADTLNHRIRRVAPSGTISTVAGIGVGAFLGDGGAATAAALNSPRGLAADAAGNLYIADRLNHRIRRIAGGNISTVAGTGAAGFSGDGGAATAAQISSPQAVALLPGGGFLIADSNNQRIRSVTGGSISTIAGNGSSGSSGDGGPAVAAALQQPQGVAADAAGNTIIGDTFNNTVRRVSLGTIITRLAGGGGFKFGGDGGAAATAFLNGPAVLALDADGNLYVSDRLNHRVRKITPAGVISTLAGTGVAGFSGDGGPAVNAQLNSPGGLFADGLGNVYIADTQNHRVRVVDASGRISTLAGTGAPGFAGDGGPATAAQLNQPSALARDANYLYIADSSNHRVRVVNAAGQIMTYAGNGSAAASGDGGPATAAGVPAPAGLAVDGTGRLFISSANAVRRVAAGGASITTVAGGATAGFAGDGGPATAAQLNQPTGLWVDSSGSLLLIADTFNHRIRQVSGATITTLAGNGAAAFAGDGGAPSAASLNQPAAVLRRASTGDTYIADVLNDRVRVILGASPSLDVNPSTVSFEFAAGTPVVNPMVVEIASNATGLAWTAASSGGAWLTLSTNAGTVPGSVAVGVNPAGLTPGAYNGSVTINAPLANPTSRTVAVTLSVTAAASALLTVEPAALVFEIPAIGGVAPPQTLRVGNGGAGLLRFTAQAQGGFLNLLPESGSVTAGDPTTLEVSVNAGSRAAGVYSGAVVVTADGQSVTVPVTLLLAQAAQSILLSQTGLLFTGVEGGSPIPAQNFGVLNTGSGTMNWTVSAETLGAPGWLGATPAAGSSIANSLTVPLVDVSAAPGALRSGRYSGFVKVQAATAKNSPQFVSVDMNVLPAGANPGVLVRPTGLIFVAREGGGSPGTQTVRLSTASRNGTDARLGVLTISGGSWLDVVPAFVNVPGGGATTITARATLGTLTRGEYRGSITVLFGDGSPTQVINALLVVIPATATVVEWEGSAALAVEGCTPAKLLAVLRTIGNNFSSPAGFASNIEVQVVDDCGTVVPNATVVATFSSGDPPLPLASLRNGLYTGTWRPLRPGSQVTVTVRASLPPLATGQATATGSVGANPTAPALFAGGVVNAASYSRSAPLAPGSIVSAFGLNMASNIAVADVVPLPTALAGAALNIGGQDVPLFFSSTGQINAQIPYELAPGSQTQVLLKANQTIALPDTITVAAARSGIFSLSQNGQGQGAILDTQYRVVDAANAAAAGDIIQVFTTGLGATNPPAQTGRAAPANPPSVVVNMVTATVGGINAPVHFAGLAPGFVGLYQVNVQIPAGVTPGSAVPLVLIQEGVPSNTVTLAVK
jgi:uncharacterized protein (TIGR03437 family)